MIFSIFFQTVFFPFYFATYIIFFQDYVSKAESHDSIFRFNF